MKVNGYSIFQMQPKESEDTRPGCPLGLGAIFKSKNPSDSLPIGIVVGDHILIRVMNQRQLYVIVLRLGTDHCFRPRTPARILEERCEDNSPHSSSTDSVNSASVQPKPQH